MCGIVGQFNFDRNHVIDASQLQSSLKKLHHRGPDDSSWAIYDNVGLGMTRLSIVGLKSICGPYRSESGRYSVVFNGEIYNYRELRQKLEKEGYKFRMQNDTEVILALYDLGYQEPEIFFRGMFAIAVWDHSLSKLTLIRDRMGKKPLFYMKTERGIIFGSEHKVFLEFDQKLKPNLEAISDFLTLGYVPFNKCPFENVSAVLPGHRIEFTSITVSKKQYWHIPLFSEAQKDLSLTETQWIDKIESKLEESIKYRLISDVEIGIHLSGGIDSSLLLGMAKKTVTNFL
ncbi:MAG: asparagine synthetase B [Bdellovibrionales bacterium]|nr:asparagine synthetase B [Bdellovibrionales bacterium]